MLRSLSLDELKKFFVPIIKFLFIFGSKGQEVIYIAEDDKVYAFGENKCGRLGLGHQNPIKEPTIVIELCNKGVIDITNGWKHVIARTSNGKVYRWGYNWYKGFNCETPDIDQCKPSLVHFSTDEFVIDMSCGDIHSLVLTKSGKIYSWGSNKWGQLGNGEEISQLLPVEPFEVKRTDREKIISISSGMRHSLALSERGRVLSWGYNQWGQLGIGMIGNNNRLPEYITFKKIDGKEVKIEKICCGPRHSLFLSSFGDVYACGDNLYGQVGSQNTKDHCIPIKLDIAEKIIDIASNTLYDISIALSSKGNLYIWGQCGRQTINKPKLSLFTSIDNVFRNYQGITNGVIRFTKKRRRIHENFEDQNQEKKLKFSSPFSENKYVNEFEELYCLGIGNFAVVAKARYKFNNEFYAIKKVPLIKNQIKPILKELKAISRLRSDYVVQYESFWIEDNYVSMENYNDENLLNSSIKSDHVIFDVFKPYLLHIQMEHCFCSLKDLIETIIQEINQKHKGKLVLTSYFIAKEVFIELLEIMSYLHQQSPPVIHGDLKPNNFLITHGLNGRIVKLVDIGIATVQAYEDRIGRYYANATLKYLAPDFVNEKFKTIDEKTDIYSLGVIIQELFNFNKKKSLSEKNNQLFLNDCKKIFEFAKAMVSKEKYLRPNCIDILKEVDSWRICNCILKSDEEFEEIINSVDIEKTINDGFIPYFIQKKLKQNNYFTEKCSCVHQDTANPYDLFENIVLMKNRLFNDLFDNGKMVREFKEFEKIGSGYWGVVLKAKSNSDGEVYAIKCIPLNSYEEPNFKELEIMRELSGKYVVQTNDSWFEENYIVKGDFDNSENISIDKNHMIYLPGKSLLLHIQMEYCLKTLREIINQINIELNQKPCEIMTATGYFVSSELFKEVVEGVAFLHCQKPPIIHRDLKPKNILITSGINGRFVKLADFGLATFHEGDDQSHTEEKGTPKYMAPEVKRTRKYNTKADIYSIGLMIQELFNIDLNEYEDLKKIIAGCDSILKQKYSGVFELMRAMMESQYEKRPACDDILKIENSWALNCIEFKRLVNFDQSGKQENFHISFIIEKLEHSKNTPQRKSADEDNSFDSSDYSKENKYANEFEELYYIGIGNLAVVVKARYKFNNGFYAIKKVPLIKNQIKPILKELRTISRLRSDYFVQYESFWIEHNYVLMENYNDENLLNSSIKSDHVIFDVFKPYLLHIQMEHCFCSLKDLIETINQEMNQKHKGKLVLISYFIAKELFIELLEIMSYLHQQSPPIIHGDLKPNNFLITHGLNGRFVKLVDIGIATVQAFEDRIIKYHANKTMKYLAPDFVNEKLKTIDQKTDIYSLGVILQELFNFNIKKSLSEKNNQLFINNYKKIFEFAKEMVSEEKILRPNCIDILKEVDSWKFCICILKSDEKFEEILNSVDIERTINDGLIPYFVQKKLKYDIYFSHKCSCVHQVTTIPYSGQKFHTN